MSVTVTMHGRLGNNLFQYAIGRIIAEHHGFALDCTHRRSSRFRGVDCGPTATLESLTRYFPNAPLHVPGRRFNSPTERFELGRGDGWSGHLIDLDAILADPTPRRIQLAGWFQRFAYYTRYSNQIRDWFYLKPIATPYTIHPRDVVVNIRRCEDFDFYNWTLSIQYYDRVLASLSDVGQVYLCGIGIDTPIRTYFARCDPIVYDAPPVEHFAFIKRFNRIVLSNSTFAWWAAFLSDATEVYAPRSSNGRTYGFTGYSDVDLHTGERRYFEVADAEGGPWPSAVSGGLVDSTRE